MAVAPGGRRGMRIDRIVGLVLCTMVPSLQSSGADYQRRLQAGIKPNLAKLTLARRIAAIVLSMWKHEEVYDPARLKVVTDKS